MLLDDTDQVLDTAPDRRMAAIDRLRAAVARLEKENRGLRTEVGEFKATIDDLGERVEALADAAEDYRLAIYAVRVSDLHRATARLGDTADGWLERFSAAGETTQTKVKSAA
jgi:uncharacterized protein YlxW (UPF0749 family)